jgi:hypothetical protein
VFTRRTGRATDHLKQHVATMWQLCSLSPTSTSLPQLYFFPGPSLALCCRAPYCSAETHHTYALKPRPSWLDPLKLWCVCLSPSTFPSDSGSPYILQALVFMLQYPQVVSSLPVNHVYLPRSMSTCTIQLHPCAITEHSHGPSAADIIMFVLMLIIYGLPIQRNC